jgi:hypothetical protein
MQCPKVLPQDSQNCKGASEIAWSTKVKAALLQTCNTSHLHSKKVCDVYTQMYMVRETMFSNQTGQFPTQSLCGNKCIMVLVEICSNAILVEPMKNRKDAKMIWAYNALLLQLKRAGVVPKKHVVNNEVSENMKNHICDVQTGYGIGATRLPQTQCSQGSHTQLQSSLPQRLSRCSQQLPTKPLGPQTKITINLIQQSNATPNVLAYAHLSGPFDYNIMPLAPMGCEAQVQRKPTNAVLGISFGRRMVSLHIARTLLHTQLPHQAHQEQSTIQHGPIPTQTHHRSLHHTRRQGDAHTG